MQYTRADEPASFNPSASPAAIDRPWPSEPVGALGIDPDLLAEVERDEQVDDRVRAARMSGARVRDHADDLDAALTRDGLELCSVHQARSSMKPAMASTRIPETAISGV